MIAYQVLHLAGAGAERDACYADIRNFLGEPHFLGSKTYSMSTREDYLRYQANNPEFVVAEIPNHGVDGSPWPKKWGQIGIWASTVDAYKKFLRSNYDYLLVIEDDVVLHANFSDRFSQITEELPNDFDFFSVFLPRDTICRYQPEWHDIEGKNFITVAFQDWSTAAYLVSRKGARRVLEDVSLRGIDRPLDWYMFNYHHRPYPPMRFQTYGLRQEVEPLLHLHAASNYSTILHG
jgi:hypothetical protein